MDRLSQAMQGANHEPPRPLHRLQSALVVGGGGVLGSALLAQALVAGRFQRVAAVVTGSLASTVRGLSPLPVSALMAGRDLGCEIAFIVFERERHSNGRDDAFHQPESQNLLPMAKALRGGGVQRLLVVVPHAPALLPHALKGGFASNHEAAVAALGFEHLVFVRAAQSATPASGGNVFARFAAWWLAQLSWMVPQGQQPIRAARLAELAVQLGRLLAASPAGTRVVPPELLWQAAQADEPELVLDVWLQQARPR